MPDPPRPRLQTDSDPEKPPSNGGNPYSQDTREIVMNAHDNGDLGSEAFQRMRQDNIVPVPRTILRYIRRREDLGHFRSYRPTGNNHAHVLRHDDLIMLAIWRVLYPRATHAETNAFLWEANGRTRLYDPSQLSRAEQRLGLSMKRGSVTARQAMLPENLQKRWNYWNCAFPFGIADIRRRDIIDLDEAGIFVETCQRSRGKAATIARVRDIGAYGHSERVNVLMAITGERQCERQDGTPNRWVRTWTQGGTTIEIFRMFVVEILDSIERGSPERRRVFTMDNLASHRNILIQQLIRSRGHRLVLRAPYYPVDGPIEYVFNTLQAALTLAMYRVDNRAQLEAELCAIIRLQTDYAKYFINCGFTLE